jgi:ParB-like chromosome segregation protein Spo0J
MNEIEPATGPFNATVEDNDHASSSDHTSTAPYQVFDRLPSDKYKYAALREDIKRRGILVPIEVDEDGNILDGHNRAAIAEELNISYEPVKRSLPSEKEKIDHVLKSNLLRRDVGQIAWAKAVRRLMKVRGIERGVKRNGHTPREDTLTGLAKELGVSERTARRRLDLLDDLGKYPKLAQMVVAEEISVHKAKKLVKSSTHAQQIESGELTADEALKALKESKTQRNGKSAGSGEEPESAMPEKSVGTGPSPGDDRTGDSPAPHANDPQNDDPQNSEEPPEADEGTSLQEAPENTPDETPEPDQPESANPTDCGTGTEQAASPTLESISDCIAQAVMACLQPFPEVSLTLIEEAYQQAWRDIQTRLEQPSIS